LVTIDIMLDPGKDLEDTVDSRTAGLYLCKVIRTKYPWIDAFALSVVSDKSIIKQIEAYGVRFLRKGETPLRTVLDMLRSRLTGLAYSSDRDEPSLRSRKSWRNQKLSPRRNRRP